MTLLAVHAGPRQPRINPKKPPCPQCELLRRQFQRSPAARALLLIQDVVLDPLVVILVRDDRTWLDVLELIDRVVGHRYERHEDRAELSFREPCPLQDMDGKPEGNDTDAGFTAKADGLISILRLFLDPPKDELSAVVPDDERNRLAGREKGLDDTIGALRKNCVDLGHTGK